MKHLNKLTRRTISALFAVLIITLVFGAATAQAQIHPFLDCVERERDVNGAYTGKYNVYFGYSSKYDSMVVFFRGGGNNHFFPYEEQETMPSFFFRECIRELLWSKHHWEPR